MAISNPLGSVPAGAASLPLKLKDDSLGGNAGASKTDSPFTNALPLKPASTEVTGSAGASKIDSPFDHSLKSPK